MTRHHKKARATINKNNQILVFECRHLHPAASPQNSYKHLRSFYFNTVLKPHRQSNAIVNLSPFCGRFSARSQVIAKMARQEVVGRLSQMEQEVGASLAKSLCSTSAMRQEFLKSRRANPGTLDLVQAARISAARREIRAIAFLLHRHHWLQMVFRSILTKKFEVAIATSNAASSSVFSGRFYRKRGASRSTCCATMC